MQSTIEKITESEKSELVISDESCPVIKTDHHDPKLSKLTLESFMNNNYYSKYLSNSDPMAFREHNKFCESMGLHRNNILDLTKRLIENPNTQITAPVLEAFQQYAHSCIKYFDLMELENRAENQEEIGEREWSDGESDHENLFQGVEDMDEDEITPFPKSFWGPSIKKQLGVSENRSERSSYMGDIRAFSTKKI